MLTVTLSLPELRQEIRAMLAVCFEGEISDSGSLIRLTLPNGQTFLLNVLEATS